MTDTRTWTPADLVPSETILAMRRIAREGRPVEEAMALISYQGTRATFVQGARKRWGIDFRTATRRIIRGAP